jgi:hypothetical protein
MKNPLAIVKTFDILYDHRNQHLEGRIIGHVEEGFDDVTWFSGEVVYPKYKCEVGGNNLFGNFGKLNLKMSLDRFKDVFKPELLYQYLKNGSSKQKVVENYIKDWCKTMNLEISSERDNTCGVIN